jgi:hypothetical protein
MMIKFFYEKKRFCSVLFGVICNVQARFLTGLPVAEPELLTPAEGK